MSPSLKRNLVRALLFFHLLGLGLSIGGRPATFLIERLTAGSTLQVLVLGRGLIDVVQRLVILPGFLLLVVTGLALTWLQWGWRPPVWVWIKLGVAILVGVISVPFVAPILQLALELARRSLAQGQLDPRVPELIARGNALSWVVLALFVLNMVVALWRPFSSRRRRTVPANASRAAPSLPPR